MSMALELASLCSRGMRQLEKRLLTNGLKPSYFEWMIKSTLLYVNKHSLLACICIAERWQN